MSPRPQALWPSAQAIPTLADAGQPGDQQSFGAVDPGAPRRAFGRARGRCRAGSQIDVLDDSVLPQGGELEAGGEALGVALGGLAIDHQAEPLLKGEGGDVGRSPLVLEGLGHSRKPRAIRRSCVGWASIGSPLSAQWK